MADDCCKAACGTTATLNDPRWRRALWIALGVNAGMFAVEMAAGAAADSRALQADALDFLGDATNYAISLLVAGMALAWRARAALAKGLALIGLGGWVVITAVLAALGGAAPEPELMGIIGALALAANTGVAIMLYRFRTGDANMRSVWICSRNDAIGNIAVMAAALGVFGTGTAWPDLIVAAILALLGISGGIQIVQQARRELRSVAA
ncbi:MAG: cation transporter [Alphaproteobacteria bacterium]|jgi:Co/Zn/Cd efflux system component|uniref:Cation efflux protein n=1 Tax=Novosphingobium subterraneum TaxID=48936 RepID=A0A0B8ZTD0_9SPHN|nr:MULTISPECIES: cation transporter [Sphingomonadaceae]KHS49464.1 cation efflux protein [Novosphingobium subterraneum]KHS49686.1 cation efflux protein [Novosphingobium subterraneum]MBU0869361.1 cation transporter [Alphaproteobacteria bacterium]